MRADRPLYGRETEIASVDRLFADGYRIVTLVGPIGVGKTAIGRTLASREARSVADLSRAVEPERILFEVAEEDRAAASKVLRRWKSGRVLVTTRRALGLQNEAVVPVLPLSTQLSVEMLIRCAHARGVQISNSPALDGLVECLGGFPLLIERAAELLRTYEPVRLRERIYEEPLRVLFGPRVRMMASAWSASSLKPRRTAEALSTFSGSWDLSATMALLDCDEDGAHQCIAELLAHSMAHEAPRVGDARSFALYVPYLWLARAEAEKAGRWLELCTRHARHCVGHSGTSADDWSTIAERAAASGPDSPLWEPGVMAARNLTPGPRSLQCVASMAGLAQRPDDIVRLATARAELLRSMDRIHDALDVLDAAAAAAKDCSALVAAHRLELAAILCRKARRFEAAITSAEQAARTYRAVGSPRLARALGALGAVLVESGAHDEALERFEEVELLATKAGDANASLLAVGYRGHAHQERGDLDRAAEAYETASEGLFALGDKRLGAIYRGYGGTALEELGLMEQAERHYREAVTLLIELNATAFAALFGACHQALSPGRDPVRLSPIDDPCVVAAIELHGVRASLVRGPRVHVTPISESIALREVSDDVRFAVRRLAAVRARAASNPSTILHVGRASLQLGDGVIDLAPRRVLWRIVEHLIVSHVMAPGRAVPKTELLRAAWGDERMLPQAAAHRLRVALSELRTKGLGEIIVRTGDGFALQHDVVVSYDAHLMRSHAAAVSGQDS